MKESCSFIISQNICVEIPIKFDADAFVEAPHIICKDDKCKDNCKDCCKK